METKDTLGLITNHIGFWGTVGSAFLTAITFISAKFIPELRFLSTSENQGPDFYICLAFVMCFWIITICTISALLKKIRKYFKLKKNLISLKRKIKGLNNREKSILKRFHNFQFDTFSYVYNDNDIKNLVKLGILKSEKVYVYSTDRIDWPYSVTDLAKNIIIKSPKILD